MAELYNSEELERDQPIKFSVLIGSMYKNRKGLGRKKKP